MLEFRLTELYDKVDYFVIVEMDRTFTGHKKQNYYASNSSRFDKFNDKIVSYTVSFDPELDNIEKINVKNPWVLEFSQRDSIYDGLGYVPNISDNDIIIIGDIDEIPDIDSIRREMKNDYMKVYYGMYLKQECYYYDFYHKFSQDIDVSFVIGFHHLHNKSISEIRTYQKKVKSLIEPGGWHLSFFGEEKFISNKINNYSHQEYNTPEINSLQSIKTLKDQGKDILGRENMAIKKLDKLPDYIPANYKMIS